MLLPSIGDGTQCFPWLGCRAAQGMSMGERGCSSQPFPGVPLEREIHGVLQHRVPVTCRVSCPWGHCALPLWETEARAVSLWKLKWP